MRAQGERKRREAAIVALAQSEIKLVAGLEADLRGGRKGGGEDDVGVGAVEFGCADEGEGDGCGCEEFGGVDEVGGFADFRVEG